MGKMECLRANFLNTTTMITVDTGTINALYLMDRKTDQWNSVGDNSDATTSTIRIEFASSKNIDRIAFQNINWKGFRVYYNSNTANLLTLDSTCPTNTSRWTQNSATSLFLKCTTITASIITIEITTTMSANAEKACGELWISEKYYSFVDNPTANNYKPNYDRKEYEHSMSDGGTCVYFIQDNYKAEIKRLYVSSSEHDSLLGLHNLYTPFVFVPEPTGTGWNSNIYEVNWVGAFEFEQFQDNYKGNGYTGTMRLKETPR